MNPVEVTTRFNDRINARDLDGLVALMTADHVFVDGAGQETAGRTSCADAWRGFFAAFPDYRNHFESLRADGDVVTVLGHSTCSEPMLAGPARWTVTVRDGRIARWQVADG